ncbi:MAG: hypothetical protein ACOY90_13910 [Candidatus Zhuqueibacterota bacterium]
MGTGSQAKIIAGAAPRSFIAGAAGVPNADRTQTFAADQSQLPILVHYSGIIIFGDNYN